jgi:hypothetical protein
LAINRKVSFPSVRRNLKPEAAKRIKARRAA